MCSFALAEKTQSFITAVISGYDIIPRMTIRGLGHLLVSVKDLIEHSDNTKQFVLCCSVFKEPKIDLDSIQERQAEAMLHLDVKRPGIVLNGERQTSSVIEIKESERKKGRFRFGKHLLEQLAKLVLSERSSKKDSESAENLDSIEQALEFTPGKIIHLEVEKNRSHKKVCKLIDNYGSRKLKYTEHYRSGNFLQV